MNSQYTSDFSAVVPAQPVHFSPPSFAAPHVDSRDRFITGGYADTREGVPARNGRASQDQIIVTESPGLIAQRQRRAAAAAATAAEPPKRKLLFGLLDETRGTHPEGEHIAALAVPSTPPAPVQVDPYASARAPFGSDPRDRWLGGNGPVSPEDLYHTETLQSAGLPDLYTSARAPIGKDPRDKYLSGGGVSPENLYRTFSEPDPEYVGKLYAGIPIENGEYIGALYPQFLNT